MLYKRLVKRKLLSLKRKKPGFKNVYVADCLGIEASYLSRFFSEEKIHFSDDLLYRLLQVLEFSPSQIEQTFIQKEMDRTVFNERREFLKQRLYLIKIQDLTMKLQDIKGELFEILEKINKTESGG